MGRSLRVQKFIPGSEESNLNLTLPGLLGKDTPILNVCHGGQVAVEFTTHRLTSHRSSYKNDTGLIDFSNQDSQSWAPLTERPNLQAGELKESPGLPSCRYTPCT